MTAGPGDAPGAAAVEVKPAAPPVQGPGRVRFDWRIVPVVLVTVGFMVVLVRQLAGTESFYAALRETQWGLVGVVLALLGATMLLATVRWLLILDTLGYRVPALRALHAMLATWPLALVTPARASDLLRGVALRDLVPPFVGAGSVLAEKAIDVQSLCLMTIVGTLLYDLPLAAALAAGLLIAEWCVILVLVRKRELIGRLPLLRRKPEKAEQLLLAFAALLRRPWRLVLAAVSSLMSWTASTAMVYTMLVMTHAEVGIAPTLALWPAGVLAGMVPITLAGMGTRDVAFIYLLRLSGWTPIREGALLASTIGYSMFGTVLLAVIGIPFTVQFVVRLRQSAPEPPPPPELKS